MLCEHECGNHQTPGTQCAAACLALKLRPAEWKTSGSYVNDDNDNDDHDDDGGFHVISFRVAGIRVPDYYYYYFTRH